MQSFTKFFMTLASLLLVLGACQPAAAVAVDASPVAVVTALEMAHNAQDVEAIVALFAEDGLEINSAGVWRGPEMLRRRYSQAVQEFEVNNTNFQEVGNSVVYDCYMLKDGRIQIEQFRAVVENGKIKFNITMGTEAED